MYDIISNTGGLDICSDSLIRFVRSFHTIEMSEVRARTLF